MARLNGHIIPVFRDEKQNARGFHAIMEPRVLLFLFLDAAQKKCLYLFFRHSLVPCYSISIASPKLKKRYFSFTAV